MKHIFILFVFLLVTSCGIYNVTTPEPRITHVLAITSEGDTINMPLEQLRKNETYNSYDDWRFYYNYNWYLGAGWYYNNSTWYHPQLMRYDIPVRIKTPVYRTPKKVQVQKIPPTQNRGRNNITRSTTNRTKPNIYRRNRSNNK